MAWNAEHWTNRGKDNLPVPFATTFRETVLHARGLAATTYREFVIVGVQMDNAG
jgi:hypothetical protein